MTHAHALALVAALLYLVPVAVVIAVRCGRHLQPWEVALNIPFAAALDLLLLLLAARVMTLGVAALVSRPVWIASGYLYHRLVRSRARNTAPAIRVTHVVYILCAAALCFALSFHLSRPYQMWDRGWHVPLTSSLRGQKFPFSNVFEPGRTLHYHVAGDATAAVLQALSFGALHSSYALSLAHDIMFGLCGATIASLLIHRGYRSLTAICVAALGVLMSGPAAVFRGGPGPADEGFSVFNFFDLSFRPHVAVAGLLIVGIVSTVIVLIHAPVAIPLRRTAPYLCVCAALLAITDEASFGLCGLGLASVWLVAPRVFHRSRWVGLALLVAIALEFGAANLLFAGSLSPGGPVSKLHLVAARAPGFIGRGPLPLTSDLDDPGLRSLLFDIGPQVILSLALCIALIRKRSASLLAATAFVVVPMFASVFLLTKFEMTKGPSSSGEENHRFMTMIQLAGSLVMLSVVPSLARASFERIIGLGALLLGAQSTVVWVLIAAPASAPKASGDTHSMNCRVEVGSQTLARVTPTYMARSVQGNYIGCRACFTPGKASTWGIKLDGALFERASFAELDEQMVKADERLRVICPAASEQTDPACRYALAHTSCRSSGVTVLQCELSAKDRREVLASW